MSSTENRTIRATRPATPAAFGPFYRALAEIAREQRKDERDRFRLITDVAREIEDEMPPPQFRPGVEMLGGHTWIDETGTVV